MAAPINEIIGIAFAENLYGYTDEPVTLEEAKNYMKIDDDLTEDDDLIDSLIVAARQQLEKQTGLSFIPKYITAQLRNECGGIEIPYGPIEGDLDPTLITDRDDNEVTIETEGLGGFLTIRTIICYVQIIYSAGYIFLPDDLKTAIKAKVFCMYQDRIGVMDDRYDREKYLFNDLTAKHRRVWDAML